MKKLNVGIYSEKRHCSYLLYYFLKRFTSCTYFHEKSYKSNISKEYDILFVSVTTEIKFDLNDVKAKKVILFDTWDSAFPYFKTDLIDSLVGNVDYYLKYSLNKKHKDTRFNYKLMPIPRRKLDVQLFKPTPLSTRKVDVDFIGTATRFASPESDKLYNQRYEWMEELNKQTSVNFDGGIVYSSILKQENNGIYHLDFKSQIEPLLVPKVKPKAYNSRIKNTKISLCPAGMERWTYRHIESIYAKSLIISTDISDIETLTPFPVNSMIVVQDHEEITPHIVEVLSNLEKYQKSVNEAYSYWNQFYTRGFYPTDRLFKKFISQFEI